MTTGLPNSPYISTGTELAAALRAIADLAAEAGSFGACQLAVGLDVSVISVCGTDEERAAVIEGLSRLLTGRGTQDLHPDGSGGVLRQTIPATRKAGRVDVAVFGHITPKPSPAKLGES